MLASPMPVHAATILHLQSMHGWPNLFQGFVIAIARFDTRFGCLPEASSEGLQFELLAGLSRYRDVG